ncbi:hypothetical protein QBC33DRAFT_520561 [Phialemonium atrogriseum]|uniref:DUF676 domain-containing protein n=1 Tax=Phialemonium atrogriseum TaxID=1093897 RepID=A0AAJ0C8P2_9PEZI|nr:uncharacterized protein QBC33DRAFT_520561 [Phialemonium atrogriseum]KAK1772209.1 hypothetical protein QBC33DRAFT_520561 [Phialemonium atrogriseum]
MISMKRLWGREQGPSLDKTDKPSLWVGSYGMKVLYAAVEPTVDIVFVHGLTGHRERTWTAQSGCGLWPQTLLPKEIPSARILTYGYDANVVKMWSWVSSNNLADHAKNLLSALATCRNTDTEAMNRRLIFVAHSLGGLVCQEALVLSSHSADKHLRKILECTRAIAFAGTPHSGVGMAASVERVARWTDLVRHTNPRIIGALGRDSEVLSQIQHDFHSILRFRADNGYPKIEITCFYEEVSLPGIGEVVAKSSATIPGYIAIGIHSNHMDMVRFPTQNDPGFVSVAGELRRWVMDMDPSLDSKDISMSLDSKDRSMSLDSKDRSMSLDSTDRSMSLDSTDRSMSLDRSMAMVAAEDEDAIPDDVAPAKTAQQSILGITIGGNVIKSIVSSSITVHGNLVFSH